MRRWLLPEHIEDILPADARTVERLRRATLDLFAIHGYELVQPPLLEYTESLLSGTGRDLDLADVDAIDADGAVGIVDPARLRGEVELRSHRDCLAV